MTPGPEQIPASYARFGPGGEFRCLDCEHLIAELGANVMVTVTRQPTSTGPDPDAMSHKCRKCKALLQFRQEHAA
jgi:phage FluMu protein Com